MLKTNEIYIKLSKKFGVPIEEIKQDMEIALRQSNIAGQDNISIDDFIETVSKELKRQI